MVEHHEPVGEIVLYQTPDGHARVECRFADETLWLSQVLIAELFEITVPTVSEHLKGIYAEGELGPWGTIRRFRTVRQEGTRQVAREIEHYNLERSSRWATSFGRRAARSSEFGPRSVCASI